ncbi:hypothetical protein EYF80_005762 [Liparis tanakae]|uniref:Uncharacterized protein n=1 Tax=Liparis tanakae TaxID=230148 RepID=A0A4Z2J1N8_9TELE|nr:hypothetical protein EYF80_005762 [Liparis tanakae]
MNKTLVKPASVERKRCWCHHAASSPDGREDDRSCQKIAVRIRLRSRIQKQYARDYEEKGN